MPCPINFDMFSLEGLNRMTALPWTPLYRQTDAPPTEPSVMFTYAMALTVLFTVFVFAFEHALDERQAKAYGITKFPEQLEATVSKIDAEKANTEKKEKKGDDTTSKDASGSTDKKSLDKDKPILPQLKEKFTKSQKYGTDKIVFGMISSVYNLGESVVFLLTGFLPYIWDKSVSIAENYGWNETDNEIKVTLIFMLVTTIIGTITSLPFELVSGDSGN